jgi:hypothetical protein
LAKPGNLSISVPSLPMTQPLRVENIPEVGVNAEVSDNPPQTGDSPFKLNSSDSLGIVYLRS